MKPGAIWPGARAVGVATLIAGVGSWVVGSRPARAAPGGGLEHVGSEIVGVVADAAGRPIEGADVVVTRPDGSGRQTAITDTAGGFALGLADAGPVRILVVTGRGARVTTVPIDPVPGERIELRVQESGSAGPSALVLTEIARAFVRPQVIAGAPRAGAQALSRDRDLAGALVTLPGIAPAAAPTGGPIVAGLPAAEVPFSFEGFRLNDPIDGAAPVDLPIALFGSATLDRGPDLGVSLFAPRAGSNGVQLAVGGAWATGGRGTDGAARPSGVTSGWTALGAAAGHTRGGRARGVLVVAPQRSVWDADPASVAVPRGRRRLTIPVLAWGGAEAAGWHFTGGGLASWASTTRGRGERLALPDEPAGDDQAWWLLGATARRQLAPGRNDVALQVGYLRRRRQDESAALPPIAQTSARLTLAASARVSGRWGVWHALGLALGLDRESGDREGGAPTRQPGTVATGADARALLPWVDLSERIVPTGSVELELAGRLGAGFFAGRSGLIGQADRTRSFSSRLWIAPRARLQWRPLAADLAFYALAGRRAVAFPLDALMGAATGPQGDLSLPAEDALAVGALWQGRRLSFGLSGHLRRSINIVEDRFSPTSGQLELWAPPGAERRARALLADATWASPTLRLGLAAVLARHEGNHSGFVDEANGQLHPAGTGAFDGPDVAVNRTGPLPFDRPYGLRALVEATAPPAWSRGFVVQGTLRGRIDAGTPRAATARSATSGPGQVFLVERGSLGRTSPPTSVDAALRVARDWGHQRWWLTLEGFNLTQHRPVVARNPRYSDALVNGVAGARGVGGLAQATDAEGAPAQQASGFARAVAYAEPLLVRVMVGCDF